MTPIFKIAPGAPIGSGGQLGPATGQQWMSWIHLDDIVGIFRLAVENPSATGFLNGFKQWAKIESNSFQEQNGGKKLKLRVLDTVIPDSADVENTKMEGSNLFLKRSKSELAKAYIGATEEMVPELQGLGNRIQAMVEERKKENFAKNILPNAFRKTEAAVGQE